MTYIGWCGVAERAPIADAKDDLFRNEPLVQCWIRGHESRIMERYSSQGSTRRPASQLCIRSCLTDREATWYLVVIKPSASLVRDRQYCSKVPPHPPLSPTGGEDEGEGAQTFMPMGAPQAHEVLLLGQDEGGGYLRHRSLAVISTRGAWAE